MLLAAKTVAPRRSGLPAPVKDGDRWRSSRSADEGPRRSGTSNFRWTEPSCFRACRITSHKGGWRNKKHAAQWGATLSTYAGPIIGTLSVAQIDTAAVMQVLEQEPAGYPGKTL